MKKNVKKNGGEQEDKGLAYQLGHATTMALFPPKKNSFVPPENTLKKIENVPSSPPSSPPTLRQRMYDFAAKSLRPYRQREEPVNNEKIISDLSSANGIIFQNTLEILKILNNNQIIKVETDDNVINMQLPRPYGNIIALDAENFFKKIIAKITNDWLISNAINGIASEELRGEIDLLRTYARKTNFTPNEVNKIYNHFYNLCKIYCTENENINKKFKLAKDELEKMAKIGGKNKRKSQKNRKEKHRSTKKTGQIKKKVIKTKSRKPKLRKKNEKQ